VVARGDHSPLGDQVSGLSDDLVAAPWEYPGNQMHEIPRTTSHGKDGRCQVTCPNVTKSHRLDGLDPIPKPHPA
jgi:hypothetical protein